VTPEQVGDFGELVSTVARCKRDWWDLSELCAKIRQKHGVQLLREWCATDEVGIHDQGRISKLVSLGATYLSITDEKLKQELRSVPFWKLERIVPTVRKDPARALEIIKTYKTEAAIKLAVSHQQHLDTGYVTISITVPAEVRDHWMEAMNMIRFLSGRHEPTAAEIIEAVAAEITQMPLPPKAEIWRAEILNGGLRCKECGSWDATRLDQHHVLPRSHQGHEGPLVFLCRECHDSVQPRWREFAEKWGFAEIAAGA